MDDGLDLSLALFICIAAFWVAETVSVREASARIAEINKGNQNLALILKENAQRTFSEADFILRNMKAAIEEDGSLGPKQEELFQEVIKGGVISQIAIANANGNVVYSTTDTGGLLNVSDREHFQFHKEYSTDKLFISAPVRNRTSQAVSYFMTRRLNDKNGNFAGTVVVGIQRDYFNNLFEQLNLGPGYVISLVKMDGRELAHTPADTPPEVVANFQQYPVLTSIRQGTQQGVFESEGTIDNISRLVAFHVLPDYFLFVTVAVSKQAALFQVNTHRIAYFGVASIFSLLVLSAFYGIWRQIQKQRQAANQLNEKNYLLSSLHEISLGLMNHLDVDEVLKAIATRAAELTGAEHASVFVLNDQRQFAVRKVGVGLFATDVGNKVNLTDGLLGEAYRQNHPVVVDDYSTWDKRRRDLPFIPNPCQRPISPQIGQGDNWLSWGCLY